ncbi:unnamed protein product [Allacma fusca]|uniref:Neutral ceramidase n=1 Tax=Allacma fusca TaxID=39272 RepID=A0A8J2MFT1_9HEXA|nr:unnamed protein product [Allacma fusca]
MFPGRINWIIQLTLVGCLVLGIEQSVNAAEAQEYNVGVGIADITGPSAEIGMMGYASATQSARGIHIRLYSRAFIFDSGEPNGRAVFVSVDCAMIGQAIKLEVVRELQLKFGTRYTKKNVMLSATHTHSGPAGYMQYALYGISSFGFVQDNFRAIVDGIVESIEKADRDIQPGRLSIKRGTVAGANINRSPSSYEANPLEERNQ